MAALYTIEQLRTVAKDKDCSITLKAIANMRERAASAFAIAWARKEPFYDAEIERLEARRASAKDDKSREAAHIARADFERKVATQKRVEQTRAQLTECRVWSENLAARELRWFRESINARGCICDRFRIVLDPKPRNSILAIRRKPKPPFVLAPDEIDDFGDPLNRSMNWYPPFAPPEQMESAFYPEELESWPFPVLDRTLTPPKKEEKSMTWHCSACGGHVADFVYASQARQQLIEQRDNAKQEVLVSRAREALAEAQSASNQSSSSSSSASERKDMEVDSEDSLELDELPGIELDLVPASSSSNSNSSHSGLPPNKPSGLWNTSSDFEKPWLRAYAAEERRQSDQLMSEESEEADKEELEMAKLEAELQMGFAETEKSDALGGKRGQSASQSKGQPGPNSEVLSTHGNLFTARLDYVTRELCKKMDKEPSSFEEADAMIVGKKRLRDLRNYVVDLVSSLPPSMAPSPTALTNRASDLAVKFIKYSRFYGPAEPSFGLRQLKLKDAKRYRATDDAKAHEAALAQRTGTMRSTAHTNLLLLAAAAICSASQSVGAPVSPGDMALNWQRKQSQKSRQGASSSSSAKVDKTAKERKDSSSSDAKPSRKRKREDSDKDGEATASGDDEGDVDADSDTDMDKEEAPTDSDQKGDKKESASSSYANKELWKLKQNRAGLKAKSITQKMKEMKELMEPPFNPVSPVDPCLEMLNALNRAWKLSAKEAVFIPKECAPTVSTESASSTSSSSVASAPASESGENSPKRRRLADSLLVRPDVVMSSMKASDVSPTTALIPSHKEDIITSVRAIIKLLHNSKEYCNPSPQDNGFTTVYRKCEQGERMHLDALLIIYQRIMENIWLYRGEDSPFEKLPVPAKSMLMPKDVAVLTNELVTEVLANGGRWQSCLHLIDSRMGLVPSQREERASQSGEKIFHVYRSDMVALNARLSKGAEPKTGTDLYILLLRKQPKSIAAALLAAILTGRKKATPTRGAPKSRSKSKSSTSSASSSSSSSSAGVVAASSPASSASKSVAVFALPSLATGLGAQSTRPAAGLSTLASVQQTHITAAMSVNPTTLTAVNALLVQLFAYCKTSR